MARWRKVADPATPRWIAHDGFDPFVWVTPADLAADPRTAESLAWSRWAEARSVFLRANPDVADQLLAELQSWCEDADS